MAAVDRTIEASPEAIWAVLANGEIYNEWVVGAADVRRVEGDWPSVGATLHHTVGVFPIHIKDTTQVVESVPNKSLLLRARVRPIGKALIRLDLEAAPNGTKVTMQEVVDKGFAAHFYGRVMAGAIKARNIETLRRLEKLITEAA